MTSLREGRLLCVTGCKFHQETDRSVCGMQNAKLCNHSNWKVCAAVGTMIQVYST